MTWVIMVAIVPVTGGLCAIALAAIAATGDAPLNPFLALAALVPCLAGSLTAATIVTGAGGSTAYITVQAVPLWGLMTTLTFAYIGQPVGVVVFAAISLTLLCIAISLMAMWALATLRNQIPSRIFESPRMPCS